MTIVVLFISILIFSANSHNAMLAAKYDVVVWGATGFTGRLCANYYAESFKSLKWAIGGRSLSKLEEMKETIFQTFGVNVEVIVADLNDSVSLDSLCKRTKVILSTAGPFTLLGTPIVDACVRNGVHYADITGEANWIRKLIDKYHEEAKVNNVKIVNCCGQDSIPADIGCMIVADKMLELGMEPIQAKMCILDGNGGFSGGTIASMMEVLKLPSAELAALGSPFAICPRDVITNKPIVPSSIAEGGSRDQFWSHFDPIFSAWTFPFIMQFVDTRIVARSLALSQYKYGKNFFFTEAATVPLKGIAGWLVASFASIVIPSLGALLSFGFTRNLLKRVLPKQGEGPSDDIVKNGYMTYGFWGKGRAQSGEEKTLYLGAAALGGDCGYGQTSKLICEAAACLALDMENLPKTYGVVTPSIAFGHALIPRLAHGKYEFFFEDSAEAVVKTANERVKNRK